MDWKVFLTIFITIFLAELGDKSQIATMLFASEQQVSRWTVFFATSLALVIVSAIGVVAGSILAEFINPKYMQVIAGGGFIVIGVYMLYQT